MKKETFNRISGKDSKNTTTSTFKKSLMLTIISFLTVLKNRIESVIIDTALNEFHIILSTNITEETRNRIDLIVVNKKTGKSWLEKTFFTNNNKETKVAIRALKQIDKLEAAIEADLNKVIKGKFNADTKGLHNKPEVPTAPIVEDTKEPSEPKAKADKKPAAKKEATPAAKKPKAKSPEAEAEEAAKADIKKEAELV